MPNFTLRKFAVLFIAFMAISQISFGQAKKYVFMEEFTNTGCAPCASQNPAFQATILELNKGNIHEMAYHPWWPSNTDPMYLYNTSEITTRTTYYNISGVPTVAFLGSQQYSPSGITQSLVNNSAAEGSPIRILVSESSNGTSRDVKVVAHTVGSAPSGNLKLFAAVVESEINYTTAPGSNGETYFPNVFRDMLTSTSGSTYTAANTGDSVVYTFTYTLDQNNWDTSKIYVIAWVQDYTTKEVVNSGSTNDPSWEFVTPSSTIIATDSTNNTAAFTFNALNLSSATDSFRIYISFEQPAAWNTGINVDGSWMFWNTNSANDSFDIAVSAHTLDSNFLSITTSSIGIGNYTVRLRSLTHTDFADQELNFVVINGVTDLVINNSGAAGDGNTYDFEYIYTDGLSNAGCISYGAISSDWVVKANKASALAHVKNIYYNVGWTFPSFTDDIVIELEDFMDKGGNLFISGQDIGWDNMSGDGYGTATTQDFYNKYLNADYKKDGTTSNKTLDAVATDVIFGNVTSSGIAGVYGSSNIYPDELSAINNGVAFAYYNAASTKIAGVRAENSYKVVYLGVGIEMLSDATVKNQILMLSYQWFNGEISAIEFDHQMQSIALGTSYPNPAHSYAIIPIKGKLDQDATLEITDLSGKLIATKRIKAQSSHIILDTQSYSSGPYFYHLKNRSSSASGKLEIIK